VLVAAAAVGFYLNQAWPFVNSHLIAHDDARSQVQYAEAHYRPGDVFLVDNGAAYAFAYYYRQPAPSYPPLQGNAAGFMPRYPSASRIYIITGHAAGAIAPGMQQAIDMLKAEPRSEHGRIWVIREHDVHDFVTTWHIVFTEVDRQGAKTTIFPLSKLGYSPAYMQLALITPPYPPSRLGPIPMVTLAKRPAPPAHTTAVTGHRAGPPRLA
jgi:hypothetical protein